MTIDIHHTRQCLTDIHVCGNCFHTFDGERVPPNEVSLQTPKEFNEGRFFNARQQELLAFNKITL